MIFALVQDFAEVLAAMPLEHPRRLMLRLLDEAMRRDADFIQQHPLRIFQCLWNSCWWYDCPAAAQHYETPENGWPPDEPPWEQPGPRIYQLLERWRQTKESDRAFAWLRMHAPPAIRLGTSLLGVLNGHPGTVRHLAFSTDGQSIISTGRFFEQTGEFDWFVQLWDTNKCLQLGNRLSSQVRGLKFIGTAACFIVPTDVSTGTYERLVNLESGEVLSQGQFSEGIAIPVGKQEPHEFWVPLGAEAEFVRGVNGELLFRERCLGEKITCAAFLPNGETLLTGDSDGFVSHWSVATGECLHQFCAHEMGVSALAISSDGQRVATASGVGTILLWDVTRLETSYRSRGFGAAAGKVTHSPDGCFTLTAAQGKLRQWETQSGALIRTLETFDEHNCSDLDIRYTEDGRLIIFVTGGRIQVFDAQTAQNLWTHDTNWGQVLIDLTPSGQHILAVGNGNLLANAPPYVLLTRTGEIVRRLGARTQNPPFKILKVSPQGNYAAGIGPGIFLLWDLQTGRELNTYYNPLGLHTVQARCAAWSADEETLAVGIATGIRVINIRKMLMGLDDYGEWSDAKFNREFERMNSYADDHDLDTGKKAVREIAYHEDGQHLVAEIANETMRIWFKNTHRMIAQVEGICECNSALTRHHGLPYRAISRGIQTEIEDLATANTIAQLPLAFRKLHSFPNLRSWRGQVYKRNYIFSLEPSTYQISHATISADPTRKRILLIDRVQWDDEGAKNQRYTRDRLGEEFTVESYEYLDERVPEMIRMALDIAPYDAVITHLPPEENYAKGFRIMKEIKGVSPIPIIAYTGAGFHVVSKYDQGQADGYVEKTHDIRADFAKLRTRLHVLLSDENRRLRHMPTPHPDIFRSAGSTLVQAVIRIRPGLSILNAKQLAMHCAAYPGEVSGQVQDPTSDNAPVFSWKSIIEIVGACLLPETSVLVKVEGDHQDAHRLALEMYSALTSWHSFDLKFDRFASSVFDGGPT